MQDWNYSLWNEFQVRRDRYTTEAENARVVNEGKSWEPVNSANHGVQPGRVAFAVVTLLLLTVGLGVYLAANPAVRIALP